MQFTFKNIVFILTTLVLVTSAGFGTGILLDYRQAQQLLNESKTLNTTGKYEDALSKLVEADSKWVPESTKKEIEESIAQNKKLVASTKNYELGTDFYIKDKLKESIKFLRRVDNEDINYQKAQEIIELAEEKVKKEIVDQEVAGAMSTTFSTPQVIKEVEPETLIPTISEPQVDVPALCSAKKQQMTGGIAESAYKASAQAEANAKSDPLFNQVWMSIVPNLEIMTIRDGSFLLVRLME